MEPLRESTNLIQGAPVLEFTAKSPLRVVNSSPIRRSPLKDDLMNKPPTRLSPFKGAKSTMSADQIFGTSPRRIGSSRAQNVDKPQEHSASTSTAATISSANKSITFDSLKPMASSNMRLTTPSRMISSKKKRAVVSHSEQPVSRLARQRSTHNAARDPASNLMETFTQRSILKRRLSPSEEEDEPSMNESTMDMTTSLNTLKNAESAKNVMKLLKAEATQPRKKRATVSFDKEADGSSQIQSTQEADEADNVNIMLKKILSNQELIMERLAFLEKRLDRLS